MPDPASTELAARPTHHLRWRLLAGVWLSYFVFGCIVASLAPLVEPIARSLGLGDAAMGAILGLWPLVYIGTALPAGVLLDRIGVRRGLLIALGIMALSAALRALAPDAPSFALAVALFGLGGPLVSVGAPKLIAGLFQGPARGAAMGIYITGPYLGAIVALSLTNSVLLPLVGGQWRHVMLLLAGFALAAAAAWWLLSASPAARALTGPGPAPARFSLQAARDIFGTRHVQLVLALAIGVFALNHALNNWLPTLIEANGASAVAAGYWASVPALVGVVGALTVPRFAVAGRQVRIMTGLVLAMLLATLLLRAAPGPVLAVGLLAQGIARGAMMTVAVLILMESPGLPPERLGLAGGLFFTAAEVGGALGPALFGAVSQATGSYHVALLGLSLLCLAMLAIMPAVARRSRPAAP